MKNLELWLKVVVLKTSASESVQKYPSLILLWNKDKKKHITESEIAHTLKWVTKEIAGSSKGISDTPVTLHVKKIDALDLTMVDLPSITREPEDIYQQI
jgi:interferon-induced GTP-binding protein Mx1